MTTTEFIDISQAQGPRVDFEAVHASGQAAVIMRASFGRTKVDREFATNWARAREVDGLVLGAYHYGTADGGRDPQLEAANLVRQLRRVGYGLGDLPPAIDFEWQSTDPTWTDAQHEQWIADFVAVIEVDLKRSPMIYTGRNTWKNRVGMSARFVHLPLWQADYDGELGAMPWPAVTIHQYGVTDRGSVPGVPTRVDRNRLIGDASNLVRLANSGLFTPDDPWVPTTSTPPPEHRGPVMPWLDLSSVEGWSMHVDQVQRLLNVHGYGLEADGISGPKTQEAWLDFAATGSTIVDWPELLGRR